MSLPALITLILITFFTALVAFELGASNLAQLLTIGMVYLALVGSAFLK